MSEIPKQRRPARRVSTASQNARDRRADARAAGDTEHPAASSGTPTGERLQKVLAHAGVASRRHAEALMIAGRVTVNGAVVRELGTRVDQARDDVRVDGQPVRRQAAHDYILLHKPVGPVTTASDPQGRRTVLDLLPPELRARRIYPVGRLDRDTEGLLLLTNDGEMALRLAHPRFALPKEYHALVAGSPSPAELDRLARGVLLPGEARPTAPARVWIAGTTGAETWVGLEIHEGRNRQVRRMLEAVGHRVRRLRRVRVGSLTLGALALGAWRPLAPEEVAALRRAVREREG
jgi:pseudouridine synthase